VSSTKAIDACRYYAALIIVIGTLHGLSKDELLNRNFYSTYKDWFGDEPLDADIKLVAEGSFKKKRWLCRWNSRERLCCQCS
jgi:hypothetical protein